MKAEKSGLREKILRKYNTWKFDRKMSLFISGALIVSAVVVLVITLSFSVRSIIASAHRLVEENVETMANSTENNFDQYQAVFWALMIDADVQEYLQSEEPYGHFIYMQRALENAFIMWDNMNFIGIVSQDGTKSYIKGNSVPNNEVGLQQQVMKELNSSLRLSRNSTSMRTMTYNTAFSRTNQYALMLYQPVFSNKVLDSHIGMLYININDPDLGQLLERSNERLDTDNYFLYDDGTIISCNIPKEIGTKADVSAMTRQKGSYWKDGKLHVYEKLKNWNYTYLTTISLYAMCRDNILSIVVTVIVMAILVFILLRMATMMIRKAYRPWGNVAETMAVVSGGDLSARLSQKESDPDMERITTGFNGMMETIIDLMAQVKEEQKQADQIRFNALQSQIQPHFLYNTLDCIHWQAVMDGNSEISHMVKALAAYYRTCLSKGRDVISLEEELAHIRNYLYIQQMRYGDILTYEIQAPQEFNPVRIPKLTLQPLVENSIYHGIKVKDGKQGKVRIYVCHQDSDVKITVCDSGTGMSEERISHMNRHISDYDETTGYGVRNVNRRIELLYGEKYGLYYKSNEEGGITVEVLIPGADWVDDREVKHV